MNELEINPPTGWTSLFSDNGKEVHSGTPHVLENPGPWAIEACELLQQSEDDIRSLARAQRNGEINDPASLQELRVQYGLLATSTRQIYDAIRSGGSMA